MDYDLKYKGYQGSVSKGNINEIIIGRIESIPDVVTFEVRNVRHLKQEFELAVDCYLEFCQLEGEYNGSRLTSYLRLH